MPFDGIPDLETPSLAALSYALRHPETWPEGFVWGFSSCETCAMGLASLLWREISRGVPQDMDVLNASRMAIIFAMPERVAFEIFLRAGFVLASPITPTHIADLIDDYLAGERRP